jgi:putative SOS response-associated peptidase YedK
VCANFGFERDAEEVVEFFDVAGPVVLPKPADFYPHQPIPVIGRKPNSTARGLILVKWGIIPNDYPSPDQQPQPFNARAESIDWTPTFAESFRTRRCLIPGDHFFEWTRTTPKVRYRLGLAGGGLFAFAGLWDRWAEKGHKPILSATIATTKPNELIGTFHDRMPVILRPVDYDRWLDNGTPVGELKKLLVPFPADRMTCEAAPRK